MEMDEPVRQQLTQLLQDFREDKAGRQEDLDRIFRIVYDELRRMAGGVMRDERVDHTLQPTALVHEAYVRLVDQSGVSWESRAHFFGVAARAMRQILVDHARRRARAKRGGDWKKVTFDERLSGEADADIEVLDLENAMKKLEEMNERTAQVVEMRIFGGMSAEETAHVLGVSRGTVQNDWKVAKMWLGRELFGAQ